MTLTSIIIGFSTFATAIIGVRLYKVYFKWGNYHQMLKEYGVNSTKNLTIIITGCNSGIGKETARELYKNGARIIMANRNQTQTKEIMDKFRNEFPESTGQLVYKNLDLASMVSVKKFSNDIINNEPKLNVLINNAAVFKAPSVITDDGFEINTQINHLAPALLTKLLLPKLQSTFDELNQTARIIFVTSILAKNGKIDYDYLTKINKIKFPSNENIYASTKLANAYFVQCLLKKENLINNVECCLVSPGFCYTRLHRHLNRFKMIFVALLFPLLAAIMKSSRQGAQTVIGCSMIKNVQPNVLYQHCKMDKEYFKNKIFNDDISAQRVYDITMDTIESILNKNK